MKPHQLITDLVLAGIAGYVGTKVMEPVSMKLYQLEPDTVRKREDEARPGPPYRIAAQKISKVLGFPVSGSKLDKLSMAAHYGLALSWAPLYPVLRRCTGWSPLVSGLATGSAMSLVADELITPAFGFSAPNFDYPLHTHARGYAAHLVFGLAVAVTVETGWALIRQRPR